MPLPKYIQISECLWNEGKTTSRGYHLSPVNVLLLTSPEMVLDMEI
jgi:hypothetical protein